MALDLGPDAYGNPARVWRPEFIEHMAGFLHDVQLACILRPVDAATSKLLSQRHTIDLTLPVPPHAFPDLLAHVTAPRIFSNLRLRQRRQLVCLAAACGDLAILERVIAAAGVVPSPLEMGAAAAAGELDACNWLLERGCSLDNPYLADKIALEIAAAAGNRPGCEWLIAHGATVTGTVLGAAGTAGHAELLVSLHAQLPANMRGMARAWAEGELMQGVAGGCDLKTLKSWWARLRQGHTNDDRERGLVLAHAAASPTPDWREKVAWLRTEGFPTSYAGVVAATRPDAIARLEWLIEAIRYTPSASCLCGAVRGEGEGAETVQWLIARLPRIDMIVCPDAARGSVARLRALVDADILCDLYNLEMECLRAGHQEAMAWLVEEAPRTEYGKKYGQVTLCASTFASAAASGNVRFMVWLREQGCEFNRNSWDQSTKRLGRLGAAVSGCQAALEFLAEHGCEMPAHGGPYVAAAGNGDIHTLEVLRRLGVPFGPPDWRAFVEAVGSAATPLAALQWLVEAGFPVEWQSAVQAAKSRDKRYRAEVRAWARAQWCAAREAAGEPLPEDEEESEEEEEAEEVLGEGA